LSEILDNYYGLGVYNSVWQNDLKGANVLCRKGFYLNVNNQFSSKGLVLIDYGIATNALEKVEKLESIQLQSNNEAMLMQSDDICSNKLRDVGLMCTSECEGPYLENNVTNPVDNEMILSENLELQYNHMVKMVSLFIQSLIFPEKYYESVEDSKSFVLSLSIPSKTRYLNMLIFHGYNWLLKNFGYRDCKLSVDILSNISPDLLSCKDLNCGKYSISLPKTPSCKKLSRSVSIFSREINENKNNANTGVIDQPGVTVKKQATVCKQICFDDEDFLMRRPRQLTFC
jgi:hypothetical protein